MALAATTVELRFVCVRTDSKATTVKLVNSFLDIAQRFAFSNELEDVTGNSRHL